MPADSPAARLIQLTLPEVSDLPACQPHCHCRRPADGARAALRLAADRKVKRSVDVGVTLLGAIGLVCVPKCPICLATYFAVGTGISLSLGYSQVLRQSLLVALAGLISLGLWRLASSARRRMLSRGVSQGVPPDGL